MFSYGHQSIETQVLVDHQKLYTDTGYRLEDLPRVMDDMDKCLIEFCAISMN